MTEKNTYSQFDKNNCPYCYDTTTTTNYLTNVNNYPVYPHRSNLFLPIYCANSWCYEESQESSVFREKPYGDSTKSFRQYHKSDEVDRSPLLQKSPVFLDDVRSAALALTSLSLASPASSATSSEEFGKVRSADSAFIFPPKNTPTEETEYFNNAHVTTSHLDYRYNNMYHHRTSPRLLDESKIHGHTGDYVAHSPRLNRAKEDENDYNESLYVKPRSYSYRDYNNTRTQPVPIKSKPRSYSFDAVGRACKNIYGSDTTQDLIGYQSAPQSSAQMLQGRLGRCSIDDGIGSSSGSADSVEHPPTKRKLPCRTIFRCMWRGCDKELTTLSGIILHVRHAHIGPSKAGEEEFYFDDVNIDSTTTSGISSSEESLNEECSKTKYRKSVTEEDLIINQNEPIDNDVFKSDCQPELHNLDIRASFDKTEILNNTERCMQKETKQQPVSTSHENDRLAYFSTMSTPTYPSNYNLPNNSKSALSKKNIARHLDSPVFNINFTDNTSSVSQVTATRIFIPTEATQRTRGKGRKKCRKVYGMSNKKLWCTQCRWKKACARFT